MKRKKPKGAVSTATPEEQAAAFLKARALVEEIIPLLDGHSPEDVLTAFQLLLGRWAFMHKFNVAGMIKIMETNLPQLKAMWEKASEPTAGTGSILGASKSPQRGES